VRLRGLLSARSAGSDRGSVSTQLGTAERALNESAQPHFNHSGTTLKFTTKHKEENNDKRRHKNLTSSLSYTRPKLVTA
jgi:hypothetical protein